VAEELRKVAQVEAAALRAARAGAFAEAARLSREALAARRRLKGPSARRVAEDLRKAVQADAEVLRAVQKGDFAEALRLSRQVLFVRARLFGAGHWQAVDAGLRVARWARLAGLPDQRRRQLGEGFRKLVEARQLYSRYQMPQAEKAFRQALALVRAALGEDHAETAAAYNDLASCLDRRGRSAEALPLHRKALAITRKALGEAHPDTAIQCHNLAHTLSERGKASDALPLLRRALAIRRAALGEQHPDTAASYNGLAVCLDGLGKGAEALPLYRRALAINRNILGEDHPDTALGYNDLGHCLSGLGKEAEALPLLRRALAVRRQALGEEHPATAASYNNLALCLNRLGQGGEALILYRRALAIKRKVWGEEHPDTALGYSNLAACLDQLGRGAEALPLFRKALAIHLQALGEDHPDTAASYGNLAACLGSMGKFAEALELDRQALEIARRALGERHPSTADRYNSVAYCLNALGKHAEALPLYEKALAIRKKALGEDHRQTAVSQNNVAACLCGLGREADALPRFRAALAVFRKALGERHPDTGQSYNNLAFCLSALGKHRDALPLHRRALAVRRNALGDERPQTADSHFNLARCLLALGKESEAIRHLRLALVGLGAARPLAAPAGLDRSLLAASQAQAPALLACLLAGQKQHAQAWRHAEARLARGLLDLLAPPGGEDAARHAELARLDAQVLPLLAAEKLPADQQKRRDSLVRQRRRLLAEMARAAAGRLDALVWTYPQVQKHLPADSAVLLWLDGAGQHWGCVLRHEGEPRWERLPGSGEGSAWTPQDDRLPARVLTAVRDPGSSAEDVRRLLRGLHRQRLAPLEKHLKAAGKLPAARRVIVIPAGAMAAVPVELLAPDCTVSYAPSATLFARAAARHRPVQLTPLVALGDPAFGPPRHTPPPAPEHGLLLTVVLPAGNAARAGLRAGDILLEYNGTRLHTLKDFRALAADNVKARAWRAGQVFTVRLRPGPLHVRVDSRPVARALAGWRAAEALTRGKQEDFARLPGTRWEVEGIARLLGERRATLLRGSNASEQEVDRLIKAGRLRKARVVHLATHGHIDLLRPERSALVLARDRLPDPAEQARHACKVYDGYLRVGTILREWDLDCDLVVLSACETALGKDGRGEGLLGFAQAFLQKGARSVLLSRWKVDDTATALLMLRFYENLLGKRKGLKKPLGRAEALAEARRWLAGLGRGQALALAGELAGGELRGTVGRPLPPRKGTKARLPAGERPFAHPAYWASFVLIGDPE
jgi:tetratricopeptide (TPR) repeat protein